MQQSAFVQKNGYLQSILDGLKVEGGGNAEFQNGNIQGQVPITDNISGFIGTQMQNNPYSGFSIASPEIGMQYNHPKFNVQGSYQNNVGVDPRVHGFNAPRSEKMYKANINIPWSGV